MKLLFLPVSLNVCNALTMRFAWVRLTWFKSLRSKNHLNFFITAGNFDGMQNVPDLNGCITGILKKRVLPVSWYNILLND